MAERAGSARGLLVQGMQDVPMEELQGGMVLGMSAGASAPEVLTDGILEALRAQFEAGRDAIGKGGLLKDRLQGETIARDMADWLETQDGWRPVGTTASPISGGDGNREYLLVGRKA